MAKSFCSWCVHWRWLGNFTVPYSKEGFHYCDKFRTYLLMWRKKMCNGVYYKKEEI